MDPLDDLSPEDIQLALQIETKEEEEEEVGTPSETVDKHNARILTLPRPPPPHKTKRDFSSTSGSGFQRLSEEVLSDENGEGEEEVDIQLNDVKWVQLAQNTSKEQLFPKVAIVDNTEEEDDEETGSNVDE